MKTQHLRRLILALVFVLSAVGTLACSEEVTGPRAWIDVPLDGSSVPVGTPVPVISHLYAREGVAEVLLSVNGEAYRRNPPEKPGASFSKASQDWIPQQGGDYVLQVKAYSKNGEASNPATVRVKVRGTPTPVRPVTPVITPPERVPVTPVTPVTLVPFPDLAIVSVEAVVAGDKGGIPFCNTRVTYRNAGTVAVPRAFTVQFLFDGTPQWAAEVAAGLAPGATAENTFVYQFMDSHTLGINLDSTSVITESDETNNVFSGARTCPGLGPVRWYTDTPTPTPTRSPTIPLPPTCSGTPNIPSFSASPTTIAAGNNTTLSWGAVTNADSVSIEPGIGGVATPGSRVVSPATTTTYTLTARCGSNTQTRQTTVTVLPIVHIITSTFTPTRTRTATTPPDTQGPPAPHQVSPSGSLSCRSNVTLDWNAVSDASGIKTYYVKLLKEPGDVAKGSWVTTATSVNATGLECGFSYRWGVMAEDKSGNEGTWSWMNFTIQAIH